MKSVLYETPINDQYDQGIEYTISIGCGQNSNDITVYTFADNSEEALENAFEYVMDNHRIIKNDLEINGPDEISISEGLSSILFLLD